VFRLAEGLQRCPPEAILAGVGALSVVLFDPFIQICLEFLQGGIELLAEGDGVEFVLDGTVETLANTVGLWMAGFGAGVVDILKRQIQLLFMVLERATEFGAPIRQDTQQRHVVLLKERQHPVIEQIESIK
jgi:hypothetical protein